MSLVSGGSGAPSGFVESGGLREDIEAKGSVLSGRGIREGARGDKGPVGDKGPDGNPGRDGNPGPDGDYPDDLTADNLECDTDFVLWFENQLL